jgi:hypothetical protein
MPMRNNPSAATTKPSFAGDDKAGITRQTPLRKQHRNETTAPTRMNFFITRSTLYHKVTAVKPKPPAPYTVSLAPIWSSFCAFLRLFVAIFLHHFSPWLSAHPRGDDFTASKKLRLIRNM